MQKIITMLDQAVLNISTRRQNMGFSA